MSPATFSSTLRKRTCLGYWPTRCARYLPLAVNLNTEKARSELVIAPILFEFKLLHRDRISLFSGIDFTVDEPSGLKGRCDYILARNPEQLALTSPVCMLVEAKNENIVGGILQCLAEMVTAQKFNGQQQQPDETIYGAVTTGVLWRFLKLDGRGSGWISWNTRSSLRAKSSES